MFNKVTKGTEVLSAYLLSSQIGPGLFKNVYHLLDFKLYSK